jgi:4-alpha-glucanotransferase
MSTMESGNVLPPGRQAGVCLHITSLPGPYGIGELGQSAFDFVDAMREMKLAVWQFLPTGPTAYGDSPYQPLSTFAGNELLIDIRDLIKKGLLDKEEAQELAALPSDFVDYGALIPIKTRLLRIAARRFEDQASPDLKAACDKFVEENDELWLHDYALYRILKTRHGERPWPEWAREYVHREPDAMSKLEESADAQIADIKVIQFLFFEQWVRFRRYANNRGVYLFGDMPICIALDSADAWAHPELLSIDRNGRPDAVAGVPPDYFSEDGQLWGNPLYNWSTHEHSGYRWWVERLNASAKLADMVRIDHFRGFEAYWSVPAESVTAKTGAWEPGPGDAIFDAMRESLGNLPIVAENLGVITPEVEALRKRHNIPGMVVLQFDVADEDFDLQEVPPDTVCYTGTHDNDTTVGWFHGSPDDIRSDVEIRETRQAALEITGGTPETIHTDMIKAAFSTDARLAIAPLQDYLGLGSEARFNVPGTSSNNWRWRVRESQLSPTIRGQVASLVEESQRALQNRSEQT